MTIRDLKKLYGAFIQIKPSHYDDDYVIKQADVMSETFAKQYHKNATNTLYNNGLFIDDDGDIKVGYSKLDYIEIRTKVEPMPATGGNSPIKTYAIISQFKNGDFVSVVEQEIHPIYYDPNNILSTDKKNIIIPGNKSYLKQVYKISCKFAFMGKVYESMASIEQNPNENSDLILTDLSEERLVMEVSNTDNISKHGEDIEIKITHLANYTYVVKDQFGQIVQTISKTKVGSDVTHECSIRLNDNLVKLNGNYIHIPEQVINGKERIFILSAEYNKQINSICLRQEGGDTKHIKNVLYFNSPKLTVLDSSLQQSLTIGIVSETQVVINDTVDTVTPNSNILISSDCDWAQPILSENSATIHLDANNCDERSCIITIKNEYGQRDQVLITQPAKQPVSCDYTLSIISGDSIFAKDGSTPRIGLKTGLKTIFEDGTFSEEYKFIESSKVTAHIDNLNKIYAGMPQLVSFDGEYEIPIFGIESITQPTQIIIVCSLNNKLNNKTVEVFKKLTIHPPKSTPKNININVFSRLIKNKDIEVFNSNPPILKIINNKTDSIIYSLQMQRCWLNKHMPLDKILDTTVSLNESETYTFLIDDMNLNESILEHEHKEKYLIESDDVGIDIFYDI